MKHNLIDLFVAFGRVGLVGFGGGPSMIPIIQHEVVKRYQWMPIDQFGDVLAIANVLPGPIATKLPGYVGYRVAGIPGAIVAVLAITLPMVMAMIALLGVFNAYRDISWIQGMALAVIPVVAILMLQLTWQFGQKSYLTIGWLPSLALALVAVVVLWVLALHPAWLILVLLTAALIVPESWLQKIKRGGQA